MIRRKVAVAGGLRVGNAIVDIDRTIRVLVRRIGSDGHRPTRKCGPRRKIQSIHVTIAATTNIRLLVRSRNGEPLTPNTPSGISWQLVCCDPKFRCHTIVPDATSIAYRSPCSAPIYTRSFGDPLTITPVASTGCMIVTEPRSKLHNSCRPATVEGVRIDSKGFSPVRCRLKPYINQSVAVTRQAPTVSHRAARTTKMN